MTWLGESDAAMNIAVMVNLRARRGSERVAGMVQRFFPRARLALTRSLEEARAWISEQLRPNPPTLLLAGGGDGTITGLLNELREQGLAQVGMELEAILRETSALGSGDDISLGMIHVPPPVAGSHGVVGSD